MLAQARRLWTALTPLTISVAVVVTVGWRGGRIKESIHTHWATYALSVLVHENIWPTLEVNILPTSAVFLVIAAMMAKRRTRISDIGEVFIVGGGRKRSRLGFWIGSKVRRRRRKGNGESRGLVYSRSILSWRELTCGFYNFSYESEKFIGCMESALLFHYSKAYLHERSTMLYPLCWGRRKPKAIHILGYARLTEDIQSPLLGSIHRVGRVYFGFTWRTVEYQTANSHQQE